MQNQLDMLMADIIKEADALIVHPEGEPKPLKSGELSYIFYNFGDFCRGRHAFVVALLFAQRIKDLGLHDHVDFIFGPAYKGIGLAEAISIALWMEFEIDLPFCSDRKEKKDHGEGGDVLGFQPAPGMRALVIDDVLTMGDAKQESKNFLDVLGVSMFAILVGVDRSAEGVIERLEQELDTTVYSVITHDRLKEHFNLPEYATY